MADVAVRAASSNGTSGGVRLSRLPGGHMATLLIKEHLVTPENMDTAIRVQERLGGARFLSTVLVELGIISEDDQRRIIRKHGRTFRMGELVCELGYITPEQLQHAEKEFSRHDGRRFGEVLLDLGYINERQLAQALSEQLSLPLMHVEPTMVDKTLLRDFSLPFMKKHMFVPLESDEKRISLVMADPLDQKLIAQIESQTKLNAVVSIGLPSVLLSVIDKLMVGAEKGASEKDYAAEVLDSILLAAVRDRASDIHMEPLAEHMQVRFRMDGVLIHKMNLNADTAMRVISRLKVLAGMDISEKRRHQDGRYTCEIMGTEVDFRVSSYVTLYGENIVMRILRRDSGLITLEQIDMNRTLVERFKHDALDIPTGVIMVTGPTGSGKTTTLYAAVDYLNRPTNKIITIEDPVEFVIDGIMQCSVDSRVGRSFEDSLKSIVRQDPDIIVIGEVRDRKSAEVGVQAALTGHKVLTTFHTEDSIGGLLRLIDMGIETFLISSTVVCILAQRLARRICPDCRQLYLPDQRLARLVGFDDETLKNSTFYRGVGCGTCHGTGYRGRTALHELLILTDDVREAILARKTSQTIRQISCEKTDLLSLMEDGLYKVLRGATTVEEVFRVAPRTATRRPVEEVLRLMGE